MRLLAQPSATSSAEALVRWRRPDGRWIAPDLFIPLAEQSGLILDITDHVIEQVVSDLHAMLLAEQQVHVAINISARDLESGRFLDVLEREIAKAGIAPGQIWLEVTERSLINPDTARATIARARDANHAAELYRAGATLAVPEALVGASSRMSRSVPPPC